MTPDAIDTIYQRLKRSTIVQAIAPDDEMWLAGPDLSNYFSAGESADAGDTACAGDGLASERRDDPRLAVWARPGSPSSVCRVPRSELHVLRPLPSRRRFLHEDVWRSRRLFSA